MQKITKELLEKWGACKEGITFFENGNFSKIDWENFSLDQIEVDYDDFGSWLKNELLSERKYDSFGNLIWKKIHLEIFMNINMIHLET